MSKEYTPRKTAEERFFAKVNKTDTCWLWTGGVDDRGYGVFAWKSTNPCRFTKAHRFSYALKYGPIPEGLFACHRCDNPSCVNPEHIFIGTQADNIADMFAKGRQHVQVKKPKKPLKGRFKTSGSQKPGSENVNAKLTECAIPVIRRRAGQGTSHTSLAKEYGVSITSIGYVVARKTWKHVP